MQQMTVAQYRNRSDVAGLFYLPEEGGQLID